MMLYDGHATTKIDLISFPNFIVCIKRRVNWDSQKKFSYSYSYSYFIEFTQQTCMKKVHDNVHKRYSDKTMLTIKTKLL